MRNIEDDLHSQYYCKVEVLYENPGHGLIQAGFYLVQNLGTPGGDGLLKAGFVLIMIKDSRRRICYQLDLALYRIQELQRRR